MKAYEQIGVAMTCRGFDEYVRMFDLKEAELAHGVTLDIAGGGSSFTAEAAARGYKAMALDPRYVNNQQEWITEAQGEIHSSTAKLESISDQFDWTYYESLEKHRAGRLASLQLFAAHSADETGRASYIAGSLPELPFEQGQFDRVLCSHFLFLYGDQFDADFHSRSLLEMMRICRGSISVYPLHTLKMEPYPYLEQVLDTVRQAGGNIELFSSKLPFIPGSKMGLRITR